MLLIEATSTLGKLTRVVMFESLVTIHYQLTVNKSLGYAN
jgi:hypothetical protein